jgi:hypothetical protein
MKLFSYKLTHDTGFAPNPFFGVLTLATCKPQIRRVKKPGDWIAGFTSRTLCGEHIGEERLIYLFEIEEKISIADYFLDPRFRSKIPDMTSDAKLYRTGDNIYRPLNGFAQSIGDFEQLPNENHCGGEMARDLSGENVLIGKKFAYFGRNALRIPDGLRPDIPISQSAHGKVTRDPARAQAFIEFVMTYAGSVSVQGAPHLWPADDDSWRERS